MASSRWSKGLRAIALFELLKGLVALAVGYVLLANGREDVQRFCHWLVHTLRLDAEEGIGSKIAEFAHHVDDSQIRMATVLVFSYIAVRFTEAYGLWRERHWAEWFAAISAALYVPFELWAISHHFSAVKLFVLGANVGIVAFLVKVLMRDRRLKAEAAGKVLESG